MSKPNTWKDYWPEMEKWYYEEKLSYNKIRERALKKWGKAPSKGTLSPHFNEATKQKAALRQVNYRTTIRGKIVRQLHEYITKQPSTYEYVTPDNSIRERIRIKLKTYRKRGEGNEMEIGINEAMKHLAAVQDLDENEGTAISSLTGRTINLNKEVHLDHWNPEAGNTLENLRILPRAENMLKSNLHADEINSLCKDILAMGHESSSF